MTGGHERHAVEFMAQFSGAGQFALLVEALPGFEGRDGVVYAVHAMGSASYPQGVLVVLQGLVKLVELDVDATNVVQDRCDIDVGGADEGVADDEGLLEEGHSLSGGCVLLLLFFRLNGTCDVITATAAAGVATAVNTVGTTSSLLSTFRLLNATNSTAVNLHTILIAQTGIMIMQHPQTIQGTCHMRMTVPVHAASMAQGT